MTLRHIVVGWAPAFGSLRNRRTVGSRVRPYRGPISYRGTCASACRRRPNGKRLRGERMGEPTRGGTWPTRIEPTTVRQDWGKGVLWDVFLEELAARESRS